MVATWTSLPDLLDATAEAEPPEAGLEALLGALTAARPAWHARAACAGADVDLFFPERQDSTGPARDLCAGCPVAGDCLAEALRHSERECPGIWGGTSARERRRIRQESPAEAAWARLDGAVCAGPPTVVGMTAYRITFESKASGGARDETTVAVRGEIDGTAAGVWSATLSGPEWQLEIRRPTGRDVEASEEATTRAAAEFVTAHARAALVELDRADDWQEWTVQHTIGDRAAMARRAAELHTAGATAPAADDELDTFTA